MYILLEYTRIIEPLLQHFDTQTIIMIIHRGRDVKILLLTILFNVVFKTMKQVVLKLVKNKCHIIFQQCCLCVIMMYVLKVKKLFLSAFYIQKKFIFDTNIITFIRQRR